jgi:hypothetical protein
VTIAALLSREARRDGARPFLTWYDDATGDRVELSVATTANWAAKIANHLVDELDLQPGEPVVVDPAVHWTTAVVLLGTWTAGSWVRFGGPSTVEYASDAMGVGLSRLVGSQPDEVITPVAVSAEPALTIGERTWSHEELEHAAVHGAHMHGLLVPLAAGASVVLVANADTSGLEARVAVEKVTHTAGVDVPGVVGLTSG